MASVNDTTTPCQALTDKSQPFPDPIPGIIHYGSINFFSGASGVGKTILKAGWCRAWLDGAPILGIPTNRPTKLYYLAVDRPWQPTYAAAFRNAGVKPEDLVVQALVDEDSYDPRRLKRRDHSAFDFLLECLQRFNIEPGSLIFIDPFAPLFIQGNQNDARDVAISVHWLRKCQQAVHATFICDANVSKLKQNEDFMRVQDRISGSGAFLAYADTQFNFTQDTDEKNANRTLRWTPRRGPEGQQSYQFNLETGLYEPIEIGGLRYLDNIPNDKATALLQLIPDEGIDIGELEDLATQAMHRTTFYRHIKTLKERHQIIQDREGRVTKIVTTVQ